ncbi:MAG: RDD family protein [Clostridia bacterium]|nr:RDD family protein [Clostridia bacterium]
MIYDLQKADIWKRASAALLDFILTIILATGFVFLLSLIVGFEGYSEKYEARQEFFESKYSVDFDAIDTADKYEALPEAERKVFDEAFAEFAKDEEAVFLYNMLFNLTIMTISIGVLLAFAVLEFIVPLIFKNGQTIGKKVFGIAVMRLDHVKVTAPFIFIRNILGKYTVETMIPIILIILIVFGLVGFMGPVIILLVLLTNIIMMIVTKTNSGIHDMLASTVVVDMASQMIFDSPEALLEYKQKVHAEIVDKADY